MHSHPTRPAKDFYLFGKPITHSPSPTIHNAGFAANGCGHSYGKVETDEAAAALEVCSMYVK